jgi:type IX secretion system PorP/SprF family membrane protein
VKRKHNILFIVVFMAVSCCVSSVLQAQYIPIWNSYLDHGLSWNPAYAGSHDALSLSAFYRRQWMELPDGPATTALALHAPLWNRSLALGAELTNDRLGPLQRNALQGHFAWRSVGGRGFWALGINGGLRLEDAAYQDLDAAQGGDPAFDLALDDRWDWNAGAGFLYQNSWLMAGASALDLADDRQYFAGLAALIRYGNGNGFRPAGLVRYTDDQVYQAEAGLQLLFVESFWVGGSYRSNGDLIFQLLYRPRTNTALGFSEWGIGYSYQIPGTEYRTALGSSHEVQLTYRFQKDKTREFGPRFF